MDEQIDCRVCKGDGRVQRFFDRTFSNRCPECNGYGKVPANHYEVCACGDYRHQHENGIGRCTMPNDLCHGFEPCLAFEFVTVKGEGERWMKN